VALLVGGVCNGSCLVLDFPLQLEELLGVQTDDARMGSDLGSVLVVASEAGQTQLRESLSMV
jgi:hypothetical protein